MTHKKILPKDRKMLLDFEHRLDREKIRNPQKYEKSERKYMKIHREIMML